MTQEQYKTLKMTLLECGIFPSKKGFSYTMQAVDLYGKQSEEICKIYEMVGKTFGVRRENVERCIRYVIMESCQQGMLENLNKIFGVKVVAKGDYLCNRDFISLLRMLID